MIDEKLRKAVADFILMGEVDPELISDELRPENLPKNPVEAITEFRIAAQQNRHQSCLYALERIELCYNLNRLAFFFKDSITTSGQFWEEHERAVESTLTTSFNFVMANFPSLYNYAQNGNLIDGVYVPDDSARETEARTSLSLSSAKLASSINQLSRVVEEFNVKANFGLPLYSPEEKPELVKDPNLVFASAYTELSQSFSFCIDLEEKSIRDLMANSYYYWSLGELLGAPFDGEDPPYLKEVYQNRVAVKGCLNRADLYYGRGRDLSALLAYSCLSHDLG